MKQCFGYVRVSTHRQGEGISLDAQRDSIKQFAARNSIIIIKWFEEKQTAAKRGRPVFTAMLKLLRRRQADGLVIHKIDRSARNFADWAKVHDLSDAGIEVHFAAETLDFKSRGGRLSADIQAVIAADYIRNLRDEVKKGLYGLLKEGFYPFKAPIGYVDNGKGQLKTIDPVRGPLVKRAFDLYASGQYSLRAVQAEMRRLGLKTDSGKPLSKGCLEKMLSNPFYTGVIRIRRTGATYRGLHEPLISKATFITVQDLKAGKAVKKVTRHNHTYRGLFCCQGCGFSMIPERQKGHVYYHCQRTGCPTNSIREEAIEHAVIGVLQQAMLPENAIAAITASVEQWIAKHPGIFNVQAITLQLQKLESRLHKLTDALIDELIDRLTFNRRKEALLLEQADLEKQAEKARKDRVRPEMVQRFLERIKNVAEHYIFALPHEKREIIEIATSNRMVWNKNVYVQLSNWLQATQNALDVFFCADDRPTSRRLPRLQDEQIEALIELAHSDIAERLECLSAQKQDDAPRHFCKPGASIRRLPPDA